MMDPVTIMSVTDVAEYLRVDEATVKQLIAKGDIPNFNVGGQPRVQYGALVQWFHAETHIQSLELLRQEIQKPSTWRHALDEHPELRDLILSEDQKKGSFGAFLKEAALSKNDPCCEEGESRVESPALVPISSASPLIVAQSSALDPHEYLVRFSRRPVVAILVVIGLMVIALGAFTEALQKIIDFAVNLLMVVFK